MCQEDPKSAEILKPALRGRDIKRYRAEFAGLWLIATFPSKKIDITRYPAVKNYLKSFGKRIEQTGEPGCRKRTDHKWFENQDNVAYWRDFEKEKIVWAEIVYDSAFYYDDSRMYPEATTFIMTGKSLKYILAMLNSRLLTKVFKQFYAGGDLRGNTFRYKKAFLERLPIPNIPENAQQPFITLVDRILAITKDADYQQNKTKQAKVKELEREIDQMVYALYGLTPEEIKIVESES